MSSFGPSPSGDLSQDSVRHDAEKSTASEFDSLPPPNARWIPRRKAQVLTALSRGVINVEDACARYSLSAEELESWRQAATSRDGLAALKITRLVRHRRDLLAGR